MLRMSMFIGFAVGIPAFHDFTQGVLDLMDQKDALLSDRQIEILRLTHLPALLLFVHTPHRDEVMESISKLNDE